MLDFRRDQVASLSHVGHSAADYSDVVGFRSAGSEQEVLLAHLQDLRQGLLRLGDLPLSLHAFVVHAGGIAVLFQVYFVHQLHYFRKAPGRSRVVQIRFSHVSSSIITCGIFAVPCMITHHFADYKPFACESAGFKAVDQPGEHYQRRCLGPEDPLAEGDRQDSRRLSKFHLAGLKAAFRSDKY